MHFIFFGPSSADAAQRVKDAYSAVRHTANFNWTFIFILAVVFYVYWSEIKNKNYDALIAGIALYSVHWLYEIMNGVIGYATGYPLWCVSGESTTFILLIGVCWELSMMFSIADDPVGPENSQHAPSATRTQPQIFQALQDLLEWTFARLAFSLASSWAAS